MMVRFDQTRTTGSPHSPDPPKKINIVLIAKLFFLLSSSSQILANARTLEEKYGDMMDIEFSVQDGTLYMLQVTALDID
jgi:hypothetical protein